jgi:hypothetical protein
MFRPNWSATATCSKAVALTNNEISAATLEARAFEAP